MSEENRIFWLVGAAIGAWISDRFNFSAKERRILLLAGAAGGLGAIFRAPLGGALTAVEVIYKEDFEAEAVLPSVISSVIAYSVFTFFFGNEPPDFPATEYVKRGDPAAPVLVGALRGVQGDEVVGDVGGQVGGGCGGLVRVVGRLGRAERPDRDQLESRYIWSVPCNTGQAPGLLLSRARSNSALRRDWHLRYSGMYSISNPMYIQPN